MLKAAGLDYETRGDGEAIFFVHGGAICDGDLPLVSQPELAGYRLVRYHRRGYGSSDRHSGHASFSDQAADARALLDALGIEKAHVVGHSYGGLIAIQLAVDSPALVHSLVLLEPALSFLIPTDDPALGAPIRLMQERARAGDFAGAADAILSFALGPNWRTDLAMMLPDAPGQVDRDAASTAPFEASFDEWAIGESELKRISQPVLSIIGTESAPRAGDVRRLLHEWLPQTADFDAVGANHQLQYHSPESARQVASGIAAFLSRHPFR